MFFVLSKTLSFFLDPANILFFALVGGVGLMWTKYKRLAQLWLTATVLLIVFLTVVPVGRFLINVLENRFEAVRTLPTDVEGIIVLGGVVDQFLSQNRRVTAINSAVERLTAFADLADRYPDAKLVFTGGSGVLTDQSLKEADFAAPVLLRMGVTLDRVIFESQSRNTAENASMSRKIVAPARRGTWVLVTSAFHMPRAVGVFRKNGWQVFPYPVDYTTHREAGPILHLVCVVA
jgi:Uncharacterized conserved protein